MTKTAWIILGIVGAAGAVVGGIYLYRKMKEKPASVNATLPGSAASTTDGESTIKEALKNADTVSSGTVQSTTSGRIIESGIQVISNNPPLEVSTIPGGRSGGGGRTTGFGG